MLRNPEAGVLGGDSHSLCKVSISKEGTVGRADDTGASRRPAVLFRRRAPTVDHGASDGAVQLARAGCRRLIQPTQRQPRMHAMRISGDERVKVSLVDQRHLRVCIVSFFLVLQAVRVQTQGARDVAVCVRRGDGPWGRRRAD